MHAPIAAARVGAFISRLLDKLSLEGLGTLRCRVAALNIPGSADDRNAPPDISTIAGLRDRTVADAHKMRISQAKVQ
jgi:hypothetical protein